MSRIFITGSSDGLGLLAAKQLVTDGHQVVLHARNKARGEEALKNVRGAETVLTADLSSMEETKQLASNVNALGMFDAVIHNAGVYQSSSQLILSVNTLAPYILTCLIHKPKRLVYLSSGMHSGGSWSPKAIESGRVSYSDSKLHDVILCLAIARIWSDVSANAVDPGWVPTKMGGKSAPDNLEKGYQTQAWLATSEDPQAKVSGRYFYHQQQKPHSPEASTLQVQQEFITLCEKLTGIPFPVAHPIT